MVQENSILKIEKIKLETKKLNCEKLNQISTKENGKNMENFSPEKAKFTEEKNEKYSNKKDFYIENTGFPNNLPKNISNYSKKKQNNKIMVSSFLCEKLKNLYVKIDNISRNNSQSKCQVFKNDKKSKEFKQSSENLNSKDSLAINIVYKESNKLKENTEKRPKFSINFSNNNFQNDCGIFKCASQKRIFKPQFMPSDTVNFSKKDDLKKLLPAFKVNSDNKMGN